MRQQVYWELTRRPEVEQWRGEHVVNLGNADQPPTQVLVIDRATNRASISPVARVRDKLPPQRLEA